MAFSGFFSNAFATDFLDMVSGVGSGPSTESMWIGLNLSDSLDENSTASPVSGDVSTGDNGYERQAISFDAPASSADDWVIANSSAIQWAPSGAWGEMLGVFLSLSSSPSTEGISSAVMLTVATEGWTGSSGLTLNIAAGALLLRVKSTQPAFGPTASLTISDFLAQKWLGRVSSGEAYSATDTWVALYSTLPDVDGSGGTEVAAGGYDRIRISSSGSTDEPRWGSAGPDNVASTVRDIWATGVKLENAYGPIAWAFSATSGAGQVAGWGLWDASSAGNLLATGELLNAATSLGYVDMTDYEKIRFPEGLLTLRLECAPTSSPD